MKKKKESIIGNESAELFVNGEKEKKKSENFKY